MLLPIDDETERAALLAIASPIVWRWLPLERARGSPRGVWGIG
jgi:hypothetical protein